MSRICTNRSPRHVYPHVALSAVKVLRRGRFRRRYNQGANACNVNPAPSKQLSFLKRQSSSSPPPPSTVLTLKAWQANHFPAQGLSLSLRIRCPCRLPSVRSNLHTRVHAHGWVHPKNNSAVLTNTSTCPVAVAASPVATGRSLTFQRAAYPGLHPCPCSYPCGSRRCLRDPRGPCLLDGPACLHRQDG